MSPMQNRLMVPQKTPLLLDLAPGAAAAYSLRQLSNSYTGPVVTVRRSTDSAEADFTANEIDNGDLAAWCMGGDGFVKTWHDQSQYGRDATQTTAGYQPKIVSAGVVILEGVKPAVQFDGTDDSLANSTLPGAGTGSVSTFFTSRATGITGYRTPLKVGDPNTTTAFSALLYSLDGVNNDGSMIVGRIGGNFLDTTSPTGTSMTVFSGLRTATANFSLFANGAATTPASGDPTGMNIGNGLRIGAYTSAAQFWLGTISEILIYPRDMTAERQLVEGSMAWYF